MTIRKEQKDFQSIREWDIDFSDYTLNIVCLYLVKHKCLFIS